MHKKILLSLILLSNLYVYSQEQKQSENTNENNFLISLHYTGNKRNGNFVSDNYNGILGLDARYSFYKNKAISLQGGLGLDYFQGRQFHDNLNLKDAVMVNPNVGIEFNASKVFKPFFNLGYSFFNPKYEINVYDSFDPLAHLINVEGKFDYNSFSLNLGARFYLEKLIYFQADYKYLPIDTNINVHLINVGIGCNF